MSVYVVYFNNSENEIAGIFKDYDKAVDFISSGEDGKYFSIPEEFELQ